MQLVLIGVVTTSVALGGAASYKVHQADLKGHSCSRHVPACKEMDDFERRRLSSDEYVSELLPTARECLAQQSTSSDCYVKFEIDADLDYCVSGNVVAVDTSLFPKGRMDDKLEGRISYHGCSKYIDAGLSYEFFSSSICDKGVASDTSADYSVKIKDKKFDFDDDVDHIDGNTLFVYGGAGCDMSITSEYLSTQFKVQMYMDDIDELLNRHGQNKHDDKVETTETPAVDSKPAPPTTASSFIVVDVHMEGSGCPYRSAECREIYGYQGRVADNAGDMKKLLQEIDGRLTSCVASSRNHYCLGVAKFIADYENPGVLCNSDLQFESFPNWEVDRKLTLEGASCDTAEISMTSANVGTCGGPATASYQAQQDHRKEGHFEIVGKNEPVSDKTLVITTNSCANTISSVGLTYYKFYN